MHDDDRDLPKGAMPAQAAGGEGTETGEERSDAAVTDGWTADIPPAENAAGRNRPPSQAAVAQSGAVEEGEGGAMPPANQVPPPNETPRANAVPPAYQEPSHHAMGIGVIDDGPTPPHDDGDHLGQDGARDTLTASEAQRKGALGTEQEQRLPAMAQNNATDVDKIAGIVAQTRQDLAATEPEKVRDVLAERFAQSGVELPDAEIDELARQITTGDA